IWLPRHKCPPWLRQTPGVSSKWTYDHPLDGGTTRSGPSSQRHPLLPKWETLVVATVFAIRLCTTSAFSQADPRTFLKDRLKLTDSEIQQMENGLVVTAVLASGDRTHGTLVLGGTYLDAPISKFAEVCRDVSKLEGEKGYVAVQEFSHDGTPPKLSDFDRL